jgi:hypothetical protein
MHPKWTALIAVLVTAIAAILQRNGLHAEPAIVAAAATGILTVVHVVHHPPVRKKLRKVLPNRYRHNQGLGLWVWNATDPYGHVAKAHAHGYGWIAVKVHDGDSDYNNTSMIEAYHRQCQKYGIRFGVWGYCRPGCGQFAAARATQLGADFYIADVEVEFEGVHGASEQFLADFHKQTAAMGKRFTSLHLSSFGRVDLHPGINWRAWSEAGWGFMPQAYSCESVELSPQACLNHAQDFWGHWRIQPTLGAYAGARGRLTADQLAGQCKGLKLSGVNVWEASTATGVDLDRISRVV